MLKKCGIVENPIGAARPHLEIEPTAMLQAGNKLKQ